MGDHDRLPPRNPRERPRKGDVFNLDGMTITVERIDFDGTGPGRWRTVHTRIHCVIHDPTMPAGLCDFSNHFDPLDFARMMRGAKVVKGHGLNSPAEPPAKGGGGAGE